MYNVNFDISGQVAAITGAGGIICGTMAKEMAKKGVKVALLDLFIESAQKIADEINANGGINGMQVDAVAEINVFVTPNKIEGWGTTTTLASN